MCLGVFVFFSVFFCGGGGGGGGRDRVPDARVCMWGAHLAKLEICFFCRLFYLGCSLSFLRNKVDGMDCLSSIYYYWRQKSSVMMSSTVQNKSESNLGRLPFVAGFVWRFVRLQSARKALGCFVPRCSLPGGATSESMW